MPISIQCTNPACKKVLTAPESYLGKTVRCKKCGQSFVASRTEEISKSSTSPNPVLSSTTPISRPLPAPFGRYRLLKLLGQGGMGAVYLAEDTELGRKVALKLPNFRAEQSPKRVERFFREAKAAATLSHPNICTLFDVGRQEGQPYLTMALLEGQLLSELIDPDQPMEPRRAVEMVRKLAQGLQHAHDKGIIHRDLKPSNIMITPHGEPIIMDFGLAKRLSEEEAQESRLTQEGAILGTPSYMSPEQASGELSQVGPASDIYSLGVILFELLIGEVPFQGPPLIVLGRILTAATPKLREFQPSADPKLERICLKAMTRNPIERFASMTELAQAIEEYLNPPPTEAKAQKAKSSSTTTVLPDWIENTESPVESKKRPQASKPVQKPIRKKKPVPKSMPIWFILGFLVVSVVVLAIELNRKSKSNQGNDVNLQAGSGSNTNTTSNLVLSEGWEPLFNGKNLDGWGGGIVDNAKWTVENGILKGEKGPTNLLTDRNDYTHFRLRTEVRVDSFDVGSLFLRASATANRPAGDEVQITLVPNITYKTGSLRVWNETSYQPVTEATHQANEWFTIEVQVVRNRYQIWINNKLVHDYTSNGNVERSGRIGLENFRDNCKIEFRSIQILRLDSEGKPLSKTPQKTAFVSLFDGQTLNGWRRTETKIDNWMVENSILTSRSSYGYLVSEKKYQFFVLKAECRLSANAECGILFWAPFKADTPGGGYEARFLGSPNQNGSSGMLKAQVNPQLRDTFARNPFPANEWFELEIEATASQVLIRVNGQLIGQDRKPSTSTSAEHIALNHAVPGGTIQFRKIEIEDRSTP